MYAEKRIYILQHHLLLNRFEWFKMLGREAGPDENHCSQVHLEQRMKGIDPDSSQHGDVLSVKSALSV